MSTQTTALQLQSLISSDGRLTLSLARQPIPVPQDDEVLVRVQATPLNPSDLGLLFGAADMSAAQAAGTADEPVITAPVPPGAMKAMAGRLDKAMPVGNEGAGLVVSAGRSPESQALLGCKVALFAGAMYSQVRCVKASQCLLLPHDITPAEGASCFINPLTALGMVDTMRHEGHHALVHTAAASNLGQMLQKLCLAEGIPLVNIVRSPQQAEVLRALGAQHVCDSSAPDFMASLTNALVATGATLGFDATGGGGLASQILAAMEAAIARTATEYNRYGSTTHKQVYIYGGLDTGPTVINRSFGMAWGVGGWLMMTFINRIGPQAAQAMRQRVVAALRTTFTSHYTQEVSLAEVLQLGHVAQYGRRATGAKYLLNPNKGLPF